MKKTLILVLCLIMCVFIATGSYLFYQHKKIMPDLDNVHINMTREALFENYALIDERTYRKDGSDEWITFNHLLEGGEQTLITFHLLNNEIKGWRLNDRAEVVTEYLSEFCPQIFIKEFPVIYEAISAVLEKLPLDVFLKITDRAKPCVFTEIYSSGMGSLANSSSVIMLDDDPPTFTKGVNIVKLSTDLAKGSKEAVMGVIAHEIAHRYLGHSGAKYSKDIEAKANSVILEWGFDSEFQAASKEFGEQTF